MSLKYNPLLPSGLDDVGSDGSSLNVPQPGWVPSNYSEDRVFNAGSTTVNELANVLATLIADLKTAGVLSGTTSNTGSPIGLLLSLTYA